MNRWKLLPAALLVVPLVATLAEAQEKPKSAKTPEDAVKFLVEAAKAGNVEGAVHQLAAPIRESFQLMLGMEKAQKALDDALDAKFGKDPNAKPRPTLKEQLTNTKAAEIISKDEKSKEFVVLKVKITEKKNDKEESKEESLGVIKEGDSWKLVPPGQGGKVDEETVKQMGMQLELFKGIFGKQREAVEKLTKEVKDDKYKTREEAMKALLGGLKKEFPKEPPKDKK